MILVLDACSISNLINVFQDTSLLAEIRKCFKRVYITREVIKEVNDNKHAYLELYKNRWNDIDELYDKLCLSDNIHEDDADKSQCISFLTKFSHAKKLDFKTGDGEYYSSLLALYISRWGIADFAENTNKVMFVTDDARAEVAYNTLFATNQIGSIIDSIDILVILYLKSKITKKRVLQYIEGLFGLYNKELNQLRFILNGIDIKEKNNLKQRLITENLRQLLYDGNIPGLLNSLGEARFREYFSDHKKVKEVINKLSPITYQKKIPSLKERKNEVMNDLIWKI
jgi:hypothetical protein